MDKQQLLKRFQTNYLSRQDVLFKLPLNISIDSFWPELLSWRKSRATMLPLHNANGQPLWFVTTDKMVKASEKLCTEALDREETFDPYRIQMTQELSNALTEESFFTSFVEGADYTLEEAIAFLRRGTEPENIMEQNVVNNFQALSYLLSALSVPLDEHFVKDLVFIITDGQHNGTVEYRTEDADSIPAMEGERYMVPAAFTLENHMAQFYSFLGDVYVHPLIKAAVSQAIILITRPFPEGNDKLARVISTAVLLRCGYDFFLDISISSFIAKENFRYFKAMREIIRAENEGDLTYFVEYFLTMLVRALDSAKAERQEERRQTERQLAIQPLQAPSIQIVPPNDGPSIQIVPPNAVQVTQREQPNPVIASPPTMPTAPQTTTQAADMDQPMDISQLMANAVSIGELEEPATPDEYTELLRDIAPLIPIENFQQKVSAILNMNLDKFETLTWSDINLVSNEDALVECDILYRAGLADRYLRTGRLVYMFRFETAEQLAELIRAGQITRPQALETPSQLMFWAKLAFMEASQSDTLRRGAAFIRDLIAEGTQEISKTEWMERTEMSDRGFENCRDKAIALGIARNISFHGRTPFLRFSIAESDVTEVDDAGFAWTVPHPTVSIRQIFDLIEQNDDSVSGRRILEFLKPRMNNNEAFTVQEWIEQLDLTEDKAETDIRKACNLGLLEKLGIIQPYGYMNYRIAPGPIPPVNVDGMNDSKMEMLTSLYDRYKQHPFSSTEMAECLGLKMTNIAYYLEEFTSRGFLLTGRHGGEWLYKFSPMVKRKMFQVELATT